MPVAAAVPPQTDDWSKNDPVSCLLGCYDSGPTQQCRENTYSYEQLATNESAERE